MKPNDLLELKQAVSKAVESITLINKFISNRIHDLPDSEFNLIMRSTEKITDQLVNLTNFIQAETQIHISKN